MLKIDCCDKSQQSILTKIIAMTTDIAINLYHEISKLIDSAKARVSREFNLTLLMLNWHIGNRINQEILKNERADYGQQLIKNLANGIVCT
jgi:hypothetical protein